MKDERIFKLLQKCCRRHNVHDLHSFMADIKNGVVMVDCGEHKVFVESLIYDDLGNETRSEFAGTIIEAANRLEMLGIDLDSIEM